MRLDPLGREERKPSRATAANVFSVLSIFAIFSARRCSPGSMPAATCPGRLASLASLRQPNVGINAEGDAPLSAGHGT